MRREGHDRVREYSNEERVCTSELFLNLLVEGRWRIEVEVFGWY